MNVKVSLIFQILSIILIYVNHLKAQCNTCVATNSMACISETQFQFCIDSVPSGSAGTCPTGNVCSLATTAICQPIAEGGVASCTSGNNCNMCDTNLVFACTGINTYALCLGTTTPTNVIYTCPPNQICNRDSSYICTTGVAASCNILTPTTTTTTTTTPTIPTTPPTYAQYFCQVMRSNTRFQVPIEYDNTCKRYIYCFRTINSTWSGQIYTCAGSTYFDPVSLYCVATRPTSC